MVALPADDTRKKVSVLPLPVLVMLAEPAVDPLQKHIVPPPVLVMVALPAVARSSKNRLEPVPLVMVAVAAVLLSKKFKMEELPELVIVMLPALLLLLNVVLPAFDRLVTPEMLALSMLSVPALPTLT